MFKGLFHITAANTVWWNNQLGCEWPFSNPEQPKSPLRWGMLHHYWCILIWCPMLKKQNYLHIRLSTLIKSSFIAFLTKTRITSFLNSWVSEKTDFTWEMIIKTFIHNTHRKRNTRVEVGKDWEAQTLALLFRERLLWDHRLTAVLTFSKASEQLFSSSKLGPNKISNMLHCGMG